MKKAKELYDKKWDENPGTEQPFLMQVLPYIRMPEQGGEPMHPQGKFSPDSEIAEWIMKGDKAWMKKYFWKALQAWFA